MKICCSRTIQTCSTGIHTCTTSVKKAFYVATYPVRVVYNNRFTIIALSALGFYAYMNPLQIANGVGLASFCITLLSGNAAAYFHMTGREPEPGTKKLLVAVAAISTLVTTPCAAVFAAYEPSTMPVAERVQIMCILCPLVTLTSGTFLGGLIGYIRR